MTILLIFTILILISISMWQISKMFELSQTNRNTTEIADDKDNDYQGKLMFAFLVFIYLLTLFSFYEWGDVLLPKAASDHGDLYDSLMWSTFAVIFFVQTVTQALLHYFAFKYRGNKKRKALFFADSNFLEGVWTIIPTISLAGLILYGLFTWVDIMTIEENDEALVVELYAQQFNWKARYAGEDGVLGDANVRFLQDFDGKNFMSNINLDTEVGEDLIEKFAQKITEGAKRLKDWVEKG